MKIDPTSHVIRIKEVNGRVKETWEGNRGGNKEKKFTERGLQFPAETYTEYFKRRGNGEFSRAIDTSSSNAAPLIPSFVLKKISKQIILLVNRFIISKNARFIRRTFLIPLFLRQLPLLFFSLSPSSLTVLSSLKNREITLNPPFSRLFLLLSFFFLGRKFQIQAR